MPLPLTVFCSNKIHIGFTFLVPAHPGSPGQRAVKQVYLCMYFKKSVLDYDAAWKKDYVDAKQVGIVLSVGKQYLPSRFGHLWWPIGP